MKPFDSYKSADQWASAQTCHAPAFHVKWNDPVSEAERNQVGCFEVLVALDGQDRAGTIINGVRCGLALYGPSAKADEFLLLG